MLYLILAILSSMLVSVLMRTSEKYVQNNITMLACNYIACAISAACFLGDPAALAVQSGLPFTVGFGLCSGALYLLSFVLLQWNISKNGVTLSALFMKLGVLVPIVLTAIFFHELPTVLQTVGVLLAVAAILLINLEKGTGKAQSAAALVVLLLCGGFTDATSKVFEEIGNPALKDVFLLVVFLAAMLFCIVLCCIKKQHVAPADVGFGLLIGLPNYFSSRFMLLALRDIPAAAAYPTYSVGALVLITLAGLIFFRERLSRRQTCALGIILLALVLLNI